MMDNIPADTDCVPVCTVRDVLVDAAFEFAVDVCVDACFEGEGAVPDRLEPTVSVPSITTSR